MGMLRPECKDCEHLYTAVGGCARIANGMKCLLELNPGVLVSTADAKFISRHKARAFKPYASPTFTKMEACAAGAEELRQAEADAMLQSAFEKQVGGDHYKKMKIQPMEFSMANGLDACQHTIIKYVTRFRDKNGVQDLEKAKHVIDMLIEFESARE